MSDVQPYQIVIILIFLGALFVAQIVIKRLIASGKVTPIQSDMQIVETLRLSPKESLHLLNIQGREFSTLCWKDRHQQHLAGCHFNRGASSMRKLAVVSLPYCPAYLWQHRPFLSLLTLEVCRLSRPIRILDGGVTYSLSLQVLALMTAVTLLPSLVLGMTSFTRIIIVLVYPTPGIRDSANSPKSGAHCHRIVLIIVHYAANAE